MLSVDSEQIATLSGITKDNGHWAGEWYFPANITPPGEYIVDVIVSYLGETVSKSSSMFIINYVIDYDSSPPKCNANELMAPNGTCVPECPVETELDEDWMCRE